MRARLLYSISVFAFTQIFKTLYDEVKNNDFRGDFQTMIGRDADAHLLSSLESNWQKLGNSKYKSLRVQISSRYLPGILQKVSI